MITPQRKVSYHSTVKSIPVTIKRTGRLNTVEYVKQAPVYY